MKVVVIGAGIVGSLIARELTRYDLEVSLLEKEMDVGWGVTKANSAIVHAGYDDEPGTVRAEFSSLGNSMYEELSKELDFEFKRVGSHVVALDEGEIRTLEILLKRGERNGVPNLRILERKELLEMEPNLSESAVASLYAPTAGITEPWMVAIAAVENAVKNGLRLFLSERVVDVEVRGGRVRRVVTDVGSHDADIVVNAAGLFSDDIARMAGAEYVPLHPRRGEYILLDNVKTFVNSVVFPTPSEKSKGILVLPTVEGNTLIGPNAEDLAEDRKSDVSTSSRGIEEVIKGAKRLVPSIDLSLAVKTFAGLRPESPQKDFFIGASKRVWGFINVSAMRSPGLTAAPAIAKYVVEKIMAEDLGLNLVKKRDFDPFRKGITRYSKLDPEDWKREIERDPRAGRIVCFCNKITEKEVVEAIRRGARTLDGVKFRTRAMFGRCQGGFCTARIMRIMSRELGVDMSEIKLRSEGSWILDGKVRP